MSFVLLLATIILLCGDRKKEIKAEIDDIAGTYVHNMCVHVQMPAIPLTGWKQTSLENKTIVNKGGYVMIAM